MGKESQAKYRPFLEPLTSLHLKTVSASLKIFTIVSIFILLLACINYMFILNDYYKLNDKTKITTSVGYTFGTTGTTALNWYNAADPRPDYYRYLPDYNVNPASPKAEWLTAKIAQAWMKWVLKKPLF